MLKSLINWLTDKKPSISFRASLEAGPFETQIKALHSINIDVASAWSRNILTYKWIVKSYVTWVVLLLINFQKNPKWLYKIIMSHRIS